MLCCAPSLPAALFSACGAVVVYIREGVVWVRWGGGSGDGVDLGYGVDLKGSQDVVVLGCLEIR